MRPRLLQGRQPCPPPFLEPPGYARHRPEATLLYQLVEKHCAAFTRGKRGFCPSCGARRMAETAAPLADEVLPERPLRQWVLSLPHALRFLLATNPAALTQVLGVVYRAISGYLLKSAGLTRATGHTGAVTLVQRFGAALNLHIRFHMLFSGSGVLDRRGAGGVPACAGSRRTGPADPRRTHRRAHWPHTGEAGPDRARLQNAWLADFTAAGGLDDLLGHSITHRIAVGPRAGIRPHARLEHDLPVITSA